MDAHFDTTARIVRNFGATDADVDDILQQSFVVVADRLSDIRPEAERAFLIQTAIHMTANARRRRAASRESYVEELPELLDVSPSAEDVVDRKQARRALDAILSHMDDDLRTVFVLVELEEMPTADIGAVLGIPTGTVASRLRRAREEFQRQVSRLHRSAGF